MFQGDTSLIMQEKGGITKRRNSSRCEKEQNQNLSERISYKRKILPPLTVEKMSTNARNYRFGGREQKWFGFDSFLQTQLKIMRHDH